ncbi:MAG: hypothetical protein P1U77_20745, partial [Rubripirellula sp.]|nr:hypothetical protein [Rubripirellula sp.]
DGMAIEETPDVISPVEEDISDAPTDGSETDEFSAVECSLDRPRSDFQSFTSDISSSRREVANLTSHLIISARDDCEIYPIVRR